MTVIGSVQLLLVTTSWRSRMLQHEQEKRALAIQPRLTQLMPDFKSSNNRAANMVSVNARLAVSAFEGSACK